MPRPTFHNLPDDKRDRVIDAAITTFGATPYPRATLDEVAERAGVSKGSLYQYFEGKSDLYAYLLTEVVPQRKLAFLAASAPPEGAGVWEVLEAALVAGVRFAAAEPRLMQLGVRFMRDHEVEPALAPIARQHRVAGRAWLRDRLSQAAERGEIRAEVDVSMLAELLVYALGEGAIHQLALRLGLDRDVMLDAPEALQQLDDAALRELAAGILAVFRFGAGRTP